MTIQGEEIRMLAQLDRATLKAANINPDTGLATDFLNHYNEVAMLIDMVGDGPDMIELVLEWKPITYQEHFELTGFRDKDLAIAAYEAASPDVKHRFRAARGEVELAICDAQEVLAREPAKAPEIAGRAREIFALIAAAGGVINGEAALQQAAIDEAVGEAHDAHDDAQAAIDALFD